SIVSATSDSEQVKLQFGSTFVGGNLQVKGVTACGGVGSAKFVSLIRYLTPTPSNITSSTSSYNACVGNSISYTVVVPAPNATQQIADVYRWTLPANTQIQSANTDSSIVSITFNSGYTGGSLIVKGQTNCGVVGTQKSVSLTRTGCPSGLFAKNTTEINPTSKAKINIFPNPNNGNFKIALKIGRPTNEKVNIQMINSMGKVIFSNNVISVDGQVNLNINNKFIPGIYLIKFKTAHEESVEKIIIQ
ncbi:MAG: T9SS type A sorting domain-containing protein, partial [Sphingobacteriales bacterium]|nr:T9SS type A sorting domain-containing protein [Sphingobacteriales bacterium]